jgi:predicted dehydrogenase
MDSLNVGIVGCGTISPVHAEALQKGSNVELVSVFSRHPENADRLASGFGVKDYSDWDAFLADPDIQAVSICTPSGTHLDYGIAAADAGKHVIVEKPVEVTLERAYQLIDRCQQNGVHLAVIYQSRFVKGIQKLKARLDAGDLGDIFMADAYIKWFRDQEYYDSGEWRGSFALDGGGVLINQAIHTIDLLQWFMGKVDTVFGQIGTFTHSGIEGEDNAVAALRFENGAVGVIEGSTSVQPAQSRRIEIHGQKGTMVLDGEVIRYSGGDFGDGADAGKEDQKSGADSPLAGFSIEPHMRQFEAIAGAVQVGEQPPVTGYDSLQSLGIVMAIYESARKGKAVKLQSFISTKL